jgi:putative ABC transport system permease protein
MFLRIALLYMGKHLRRTLVIVIAVAVSVAVIVFIEALLAGLTDSFFQNLFQDSGHLQIHEEGYADRLDPYTIDYLVTEPDTVAERLLDDPRVETAEPLVPFGGLLVREGKNLPTGAVGLLADSVFYGKVRRGMVEGGMPQTSDEIAVSRETAELLDIEMGGDAVLLVEDTTGSPYYAQLEVTGLFATDSSEFDTSHVFVTVDAATELLYLQSAAIEVRALLSNPEDAPALKDTLSGFLEQRGLEASTWQEIHGSFVVAFELFDVFMVFIDVVLAIVAATVIANAILMNVFERGPEFGTLRAIGMKRRQQAWMILTEGGLEGVAGSILGLLLGIAVVAYLGANGLRIGEFSESFGLGRVLYPSLSTVLVIRSFVAGVFIALASSGYVTLVSARRPIMSLLSQA